MEHIIVSQIMKHLDEQKILSDRQFGFRCNHSCESQLCITINDIAKCMDRNLQVDSAVLDFSKVFDKVSHSKLLYKLSYYGIYVLHWLQSFLQGHKQSVVVEGSRSSISDVTSGVLLGPILFLVYINDIITKVKREIRLFADDILIYKAIQTPHDRQTLQDDLNCVT